MESSLFSPPTHPAFFPASKPECRPRATSSSTQKMLSLAGRNGRRRGKARSEAQLGGTQFPFSPTFKARPIYSPFPRGDFLPSRLTLLSHKKSESLETNPSPHEKESESYLFSFRLKQKVDLSLFSSLFPTRWKKIFL